MPEIVTQDNRFIYVETPLGKDKLLLLSFSGYEEISRLFSFQLEMLSLDFNINFADIVGKNVTFGLPGLVVLSPYVPPTTISAVGGTLT